MNRSKIQKSNRLSIAHINTHDVAGGAAKVAWRLAQNQRSSGHNAKTLVGQKMVDSPHSTAFSKDVNPVIAKHCIENSQLFYQFQGSHKLIDHPLVKSANILHAHNLHGCYFNPFSLSALTHSKPFVWTLHDMQSFTGHCAHSFDCVKWKSGCGNCPYLQTEPALTVDTSAQLLSDKKLIYDHSFLQLVTPSNWLKEKVEKSILKNHPVELIYNSIDTTIFEPYDKSQTRRQFGIPENVPVIGAVAHGGALKNHWKGGKFTQAALQALPSNFVFVNIGGDYPTDDPRIINIPHITDESELAQAYSTLDIFLNTSIADNCPLVILEAMSCGVPVVSFDTGGIAELVLDNMQGRIAPYCDQKSIIKILCETLGNTERLANYSQSARQRAVTTFDNKIIAQQYENLYMRVLEHRMSHYQQPKMLPLSKLPQVVLTKEFLEAESKKNNHKNAEAKPMSQIKPPVQTQYDVSIVLGTKDRAQLLDRMLASLKNACTGIKCEVIVIDGNSSDNTLQVLHKHGIIRVYSESQCLGPGRHSWGQISNFGFAKARGKWVMYGSDDIVFSKNCLTKAVNALNTQGDEVAAGVFFYRNTQTRPDWDKFGIDFTLGQKLLMNYGLFRLDYFKQVGGLNEQYRFYCSDGDLCYKLYSAGKQLIVLPECFVEHNNILDKHKQENAAAGDKDIALYKENWKHYVSVESPNPRRLLWHEDYANAFNMPMSLERKGPELEYFWHGLSCFQYGMFDLAAIKFQQAIEAGFNHDLVRWFLKKSQDQCSPQQKQYLADEFIRTQNSPVVQTETLQAQSTTSLDKIKELGLWNPTEPLRLHLGCGKWRFDGYVNIDYPPEKHNVAIELGADLHADITQLTFDNNTVDEIRLHHVFEHFNRVNALALLIRWHRWLKTSGRLHIETPDLIGSAKTLLSNESWKTKMGVVRHIAGDQASQWGYHVDHWSAERFDHTLKKLGFDSIQTQINSWQQEPFLSNVEVLALKARDISLQEQLTAADELLWESTVADKEEKTWQVWRQQLRQALEIELPNLTNEQTLCRK